MQLEIYQHLPEHINPIIFQIGFFSIKWYSLMYLAGFAVVYFLLRWRIKNEEFETTQHATHNTQYVFDLMIYLITGLLIGARLGYVLFYDLNYFFNHPLEIFLPIQVMGFGLRVTGLSGMSYYGGLIGIIIASLVFIRLRGSASLNQNDQKRPNLFSNFWQLADFVVPAVPAGYFFGRIGNFLNGELYGRVTEKFWGMYFPADPENLLRHPSQLYEAFFEGLVLFLILWTIRNNKKLTSRFPLLTVYLFSYGFFRFLIEFFREPDHQIGLFFGWLSLGQVFSALTIITAVFIILIRKKPGISQYAKNGL